MMISEGVGTVGRDEAVPVCVLTDPSASAEVCRLDFTKPNPD